MAMTETEKKARRKEIQHRYYQAHREEILAKEREQRAIDNDSKYVPDPVVVDKSIMEGYEKDKLKGKFLLLDSECRVVRKITAGQLAREKGITYERARGLLRQPKLDGYLVALEMDCCKGGGV